VSTHVAEQRSGSGLHHSLAARVCDRFGADDLWTQTRETLQWASPQAADRRTERAEGTFFARRVLGDFQSAVDSTVVEQVRDAAEAHAKDCKC